MMIFFLFAAFSFLMRLAQSSCTCVFDFDLTLRIIKDSKQDFPAPDANRVIEGCQSKGCRVAIASANGNAAKIRSVLSKIDPSIFNDSFFNTPAFQYGNSDKTISLRAIQGYTGTSPACIFFFDDQWHNKQYADRTGISFIKVEPKIGVSWANLTRAVLILEKNKCIN